MNIVFGDYQNKEKKNIVKKERQFAAFFIVLSCNFE